MNASAGILPATDILIRTYVVFFGSPARVMVGGDWENLERQQDAPTVYTITKIIRTGARCSHCLYHYKNN
ncbi:hypothetical protein [Okeania sp. SIO1I7]|uniref:hypothetical protein n=1 Tax=Okeania sp. SIO1I7 TaxID=2607772 RepID=UPI0013F9B3B1|nr:hypothetical protein [Okeania sp. SIO1I7]NET24849.1 hypothetical protein [Okeania sp. SIO1I7]